MARLKSKQLERILSASIKVAGVAVTASSSSATVTSPLTSSLTIAGDGGAAVPLIVSSGYNTPGIITSNPLNRCEVYDSTSKKKIATTSGQEEVYGRLTQSSGVYTLSFYYLNNSGVESPYIFSANTTIDFDFNYRYELYQLPADSLISQIARNVYQDPKGSGAGIVVIEQLSVFSLNSVAPLSNTPNDVTKVELYVNGQEIDALGGGSAAFSISGGVNITWSSSNAGFSLETTDRVIAKYYI